jgi:hypothetical protein
VGEQLQVVLLLEARTGRDHLGEDARRLLRDVQILVDLTQQRIVRLRVPVGGEHRIQLVHDGTRAADHEVLPHEPAAQVRRLVVGRMDDVLRTREGDVAVDHQDLAVIAQIQPLVLAPPRPDGHAAPPQEAGRVQELHERAIARVPQRPQVVDEDPHLDAALMRVDESVEQLPGRVVQGDDVELEVHEALRPAHLLGHLLDAVD